MSAVLEARLLTKSYGRVQAVAHEQMAYHIGSIVVAVYASIVGVRSFTDDFRHGTIVPTVLLSPSRGRLLVAKIMVAMSVVLVMSVLGMASLVGAAVTLARIKGGDLTVAGSDWTAFAGFVGAMLVWAVLGTGLGAIVRNQIVGVVGLLVWMIVVENFSTGFFGHAVAYLPGRLALGMAQAGGAADLVAVRHAVAIFVGYALLVALGASVTLDRRDVI